jgi:hypothetical protein
MPADQTSYPHRQNRTFPMRDGTYRDQTGQLATVRTTPTGYLIRYRDGRVISIPTTTSTGC